MPLTLRAIAYMGERFLLRHPTLIADVPEFGLTLRVPTYDVVGRHLYRYGIHEPLLSRFVFDRLELRPGDVVFDVGGNIGWYSLLLSCRPRADAEVFTFEPAPENYALLVENLRRNGAWAVTPVQAAVGDTSGHAVLHLYGEVNRGRHSLLPINSGPTVGVDLISLDDFCRQRGLDRRPVGFMKLDIEGYEYFALRGAAETLKRCRAILTEFSPAYLNAAHVNPEALLDLLSDTGFRPHAVSSDGMIPIALAELRNDSQQIDLLWLRGTN